MRLTYDSEADALYFSITSREVHQTKHVDENTLVDLDKEGNVIGVEVLFVKERMPEFIAKIEAGELTA